MTPYYQDEAVTIWNGDCRELLPYLAPVELVITSPPYFNARSYSSWATYSDYLNEMRRMLVLVKECLVPGRMCCINAAPVIVPRESRSGRSRRHNIPSDIHSLAVATGMWFQEDLVWEKPEGAAINRSQRFSVDRHPLQWRANARTERVLVYQTPTKLSNDAIIAAYGGIGRINGDFDRSDVWAIHPVSSPDHPAPFPIGLPRRLIRYYSWAGDTVLDPYAGSGTTLLAARESGRKAIGIEIEERYCEIAANRCAQEGLPTRGLRTG